MAKKPEPKKADAIDDQIDGTIETQSDDTVDAQTETDEADIAEAAAPEADILTDLHGRVSKAAAAIQTTGPAAAVHALNKIEHLTGSLKHSLPAAIAAATDAELKADLQTLLALL